MKRLFVLGFAVLMSTSVFAQKEIEKYVENVFEALKKRDPIELMPYFETEKEFKEIEEKHYGETYMKDKQYVSRLYEKKKKQWFEDLKKMFEQGEEAGIVWSEIEFKSFTFDNNVPLYDHRKEDIEIFFTYKDKTYQVKLITAIYFKKGWKIREDIAWIGEEEEE